MAMLRINKAHVALMGLPFATCALTFNILIIFDAYTEIIIRHE